MHGSDYWGQVGCIGEFSPCGARPVLAVLLLEPLSLSIIGHVDSQLLITFSILSDEIRRSFAAGGGLDPDFGRILVDGFDRFIESSKDIFSWTLANSPTLIAAREEDGHLAVEVQLGGLRPIPRSLLKAIEVGLVVFLSAFLSLNVVRVI